MIEIEGTITNVIVIVIVDMGVNVSIVNIVNIVIMTGSTEEDQGLEVDLLIVITMSPLVQIEIETDITITKEILLIIRDNVITTASSVGIVSFRLNQIIIEEIDLDQSLENKRVVGQTRDVSQ